MFLQALIATFLILTLSFCSSDSFAYANDTAAAADSSRTKRSLRSLQGIRAAIFSLHLEGNLGEEMELIPFLQELYDKGVIMDGFLSPTKNFGKPKVDPKMVRPLEFLRKVYELPPTDFEFYNNYDVFIVGPGSTEHGPISCFGSTPLIWFGVSVDEKLSTVYNKFKNCLVLSVFRETESLSAFKALLTATRNTLEPKVVISGDLSYSFEPLPAVFDHWKEEFISHMKPPIVFQNWAVIFCHSDNFGRNVGQNVNIIDGKVHIKDINGRPVAFALESVIWAASAQMADDAHFKQLTDVHRVEGSRVVSLGSIEQMMALISIAPHIVTDRYHPAVLAIRFGAKVTLVKHGVEDIPMKGLTKMLDYTPNKFKLLNTAAFAALSSVLSRVDQDLGVVVTHVEDTKVLLSDQKRKNAIMAGGGLPEEEKDPREKSSDGKTILEGFTRIDPPKIMPNMPSVGSQRPDYSAKAQEARTDAIFSSHYTERPSRQNTPSYEKRRSNFVTQTQSASFGVRQDSPEVYAEHTHIVHPNAFDKVKQINNDQQQTLERLMQSPEFREQSTGQSNPVRSDNENLIKNTKLRMQRFVENHEAKKKKNY